MPARFHLLAEGTRPAVIGLPVDDVSVDLVQFHNLAHLVDSIGSAVSATGTGRIDPIHVDQEFVDSVNK